MRYATIILSAVALAAGCAKSTGESAQPGPAPADAVVAQPAEIVAQPVEIAPAPPAIENVIWFRDDAGAPPGEIRVFATDGSLLMDSCYETFRIARWRRVDGDTIAWTEDASEIIAEIANATASNLTLVLHLRNETVTQSWSRKDGEFLCPSIR
jgi:hypothetical protein